MAEKTPISATLPSMNEINAMIETRSLIRRTTIPIPDSSTNVNSAEERENMLQLTSSRISGNSVVIWLDPNINTNDEDIKYSITQLQHIVADLKTFTDADECRDFLTNIVNEKAFMIISGQLGHQILSLIQDISQLHSIYIFCEHQARHEEWVKEYRKVKGVFNQIKSICDTLKRDVRQSESDMAPISIMSIPSTINLDELDPSFMYSQLLKETILNIEFDKEAKAKFANFCRVNYADNKTQLQKIDTFEREYAQHSAIWWYTKEPFIYSTLNKALRTQDITIIIIMAFFLKDLHREIEKLHQKSQETSEIIVYRGQVMLNADFEKMKNSEGALLSFNNFLSTSSDPEVANIFAMTSPDDPNSTGVLFKMKIDPLVSTSPFGLIDNISFHFDNEKEILFSMHTIFRITELQRMDHDRLWEVTLTSTSDNDKQLLQLTNHIQNELGTDSGWVRLGHLMYQMGAFEKAEQIYKTVIETACGNDDTELLETLIPIYNNLAVAQNELGKYSIALSHLQTLLTIKKKFLPANHLDLVATNNNIGVSHRSRGEYGTALSYFEKALEIQQKSLPHNHPDLATINNNIGMTHQLMGDYPTALSYFKKTLEIQQKSLPHNHPALAMTNNNIGITHQSMGDYSTPLSYFEKTVEIERTSLPENHPALATTNNNFGVINHSIGNYPAALSFFKKTLEIRQEFLPPDHPALATANNNIGMTHQSMGDYPTALSYFEKTLEIQQKSLSLDHPALATTKNNIGTIYELMEEHSTALSYFEKALEIQQKSLRHDHPDLATTNNNIGMIYESMGDYPTALSYFEKTLEIQQKSLSPDHPNCAILNNNIGTIYKSMGDYSTALSYFKKTLEIKQKSLGHDHPALATTNNNIGVTYKLMGQFRTALSYYEKAIEIQQKSLPPDHPALATANNNIGMTHRSMGDYPTALLYFQKTLEIQQKSLSPDHPALATTKNNIGTIYEFMEEHSTALSYFEEAPEI
jgi:tetratricopeptide (TPR) repeat protein